MSESPIRGTFRGRGSKSSRPEVGHLIKESSLFLRFYQPLELIFGMGITTFITTYGLPVPANARRNKCSWMKKKNTINRTQNGRLISQSFENLFWNNVRSNVDPISIGDAPLRPKMKWIPCPQIAVTVADCWSWKLDFNEVALRILASPKQSTLFKTEPAEDAQLPTGIYFCRTRVYFLSWTT